MYCLRASNVNVALPLGLSWLYGYNGVREPSRNGDVLVSRMPVMTIYDDITHRVLFNPVRDANPFFHLFEALWMLDGRNDLATIAQFNKQMVAYSDDGGITQPAAYGHRWRNYFGYDQIKAIVEELKANPHSRRCVLAMWNPGGDRDNDILIGVSDLYAAMNGSADVPCNTQVYFRIHNGVLDMSVTCRSNDIYWGAYGANAVHFTMLQEYIAHCVGVQPGKLYQYSWNYHLYTDIVSEQKMVDIKGAAQTTDYYATHVIRPMPLVNDVQTFDTEVGILLDMISPVSQITVDELRMFNEPFLDGVALPMWHSWVAHKRKDYAEAERYARSVKADDWRMAATEWMERRAMKHRQKMQVKA